ncbi:protein ABHD1 [Thrips palmi]|uniref:Protein ABHD1 n=1 Tax=Thrips palmi TaxID=161013 RepID=A0A6P9A6Y6_THRPL|nr:protein ABHD1 [Thrips palmi]
MDFLSSAIPSLDSDFLPRWYLAAFVVSGYVIYYICEVAKVPQLACAPGEFRSFLEQKVPILKERFWPTIWCIESRAQTVLANVFRERLMKQVHYRREVLDLPDGGQLALDWLEDNCTENSPILLILPGLTGSSQAEYIRCLVQAVNRSGFRTVVFNNRGLGGVVLKTPRLYNACNGEDLAEAIKLIKAKNPNVPLAATGISMGGLVLGNYISRRGKSVRSELAAAMLISVPWDLFKACESIEKPGLNMMLNKHLADLLCQTLKKQNHLDWGNLDDTFKSRTIREFDSKFTCKAFGYSDTNEYYSDATLHTKLHQFQIPTLCLSAADDPFQPLDAIPVDEFNKCKNIAAVVTARGGHIGFMEGFLPSSYRGKDDYMDRILCQYFSAIFRDGGKIMAKLDG